MLEFNPVRFQNRLWFLMEKLSEAFDRWDPSNSATWPQGMRKRVGWLTLSVAVFASFLLVSVLPESFGLVQSCMLAIAIASVSAIGACFYLVRPLSSEILDHQDRCGRLDLELCSARKDNLDRSADLLSVKSRLKVLDTMLDEVALVAETDEHGIITRVNDNFCRISGYEREELVGTSHALMNSSIRPNSSWKELYAVLGSKGIWQSEVCNRAKNGSYYWVRSFDTAVRSNDGALDGYMSVRFDISELKSKEATLKLQNVSLDVALNAMGRGLSMFDAKKRLIICNQAYRQIYNLPESLTQPGTPLTEIMTYRGSEASSGCSSLTEDEQLWLADLDNRLLNNQTFSETQELADGRVFRVTFRPLPSGGWVDTQEDITLRLRQEAQITYMAHHDTLTGLPNRLSLTVFLERLLDDVQSESQFAVHFLDLDGFKAVNDRLGHIAGDELLVNVAKRLRNCIREDDLIARLGGDEFAIVQADVSKPEQAERLAERVLDAIQQPFRLERDCQVAIGTSIGIAFSPKDGCDPTTLLRHSDTALYESKHNGRNRWTFYRPELAAIKVAKPNSTKKRRSLSG